MQPSRPPRGPGSFSPLPVQTSISTGSALSAVSAASAASSSSSPSPTLDRPPLRPPGPNSPSSIRAAGLPVQRSPRPAGHMRSRRMGSDASDDSIPTIPSPLAIKRPSQTTTTTTSTATTTTSSHNFSRPAPLASSAAATAAARQVAVTAAATASALSAASSHDMPRAVSPLTLPNNNNTNTTATGRHDGSLPTSPVAAFKTSGHSRKHSQTAGLFDVSMPSTNSGNNLSQVIMAQQQQPPQSQPQQTTPTSATFKSAGRSTSSPPPPSISTIPPRELNASQIAAQAAILQQQQHQQQQLQIPQQEQYLQQQQQIHHARQRSQTVPTPGEAYETPVVSSKRSSGPMAMPILSLTEASAPRDSGFENTAYHNGLLGSHASAAQTAASVVFSRSGAAPSSPKAVGTQQTQAQSQAQPQIQPSIQSSQTSMPPPPPPKSEKSKVKLFSRPGKIMVKGDIKDKPLPSPSKMGLSSALASLQRGNFSTTSVDASAQSSFYNLNNSSAATIRPSDSTMGLGMAGNGAISSSNSSATLVGAGANASGLGSGGGVGSSSGLNIVTVPEKESKEKKHHFLSRQKHKLKDKDDFHLPLSSAASNSRPTDPNAPSSLYNFSLPVSSPGPGTTTFKGKSGLDLRHGGRALREKKKDDKAAAAAAAMSEMGDGSVAGFTGVAGGAGSVAGGALSAGGAAGSDWPGPGSYGSGGGFLTEPTADAIKFGLNNMSYDDAWPYLKAKLQVIFEGEDLRIPVEHLNRIVVMHIQYCIQRRAPNIILDDLRDLLANGFASLDRTLRQTPEDRLIPALVELWLFTFTSILPYMQAVFLPLDLEFSGTGTLLTPEKAREFWGGVTGANAATNTAPGTAGTAGTTGSGTPGTTPLAAVLDVRRLVLASYRDCVILPRYDTLKPIFSRLSLEFLPQSLAGMAKAHKAGGSSSSGSGGPTMPIPIRQKSRSNSALAQQYQAAGAGGAVSGTGAGGVAHSYGSFGSFGSMGNVGVLPSQNVSTSPAESAPVRPGTATSLDPSVAASSSGSGGGGGGGGGITDGNSRSRAISNVSFGSNSERGISSIGGFLNSNSYALGGNSSIHAVGLPSPGLREQNVEDSKQVTEMVGRMLQCMSVLAGVGVAGVTMTADGADDEGSRMVEELSRLLKLNWLGRGRTGRNRRGMVGGRVKRGVPLGGIGGLSSMTEAAMREGGTKEWLGVV